MKDNFYFIIVWEKHSLLNEINKHMLNCSKIFQEIKITLVRKRRIDLTHRVFWFVHELWHYWPKNNKDRSIELFSSAGDMKLKIYCQSCSRWRHIRSSDRKERSKVGPYRGCFSKPNKRWFDTSALSWNCQIGHWNLTKIQSFAINQFEIHGYLWILMPYCLKTNDNGV